MNPLQTTGPGLQNLCGEITDAGGDCKVVLAVTGGNGDHTRERTLGMTGVSSEIATTAPAVGLATLAVLIVLVLAAIATTLRRRAR